MFKRKQQILKPLSPLIRPNSNVIVQTPILGFIGVNASTSAMVLDPSYGKTRGHFLWFNIQVEKWSPKIKTAGTEKASWRAVLRTEVRRGLGGCCCCARVSTLTCVLGPG
ncbi:hypothetical protein ES332_A10G257700v1 [Gossypium tomentosum]|uniref:Uncharacterized protein n=1 Tax=Gossypium tomentosum TaxID=34277 RepID=A0A5D2NXS8_GOSTO|nr:hypothetical protein ES332_A10G257700v1 [Gossypium tomentosum]